jgi:hypothetical protein
MLYLAFAYIISQTGLGLNRCINPTIVSTPGVAPWGSSQPDSSMSLLGYKEEQTHMLLVVSL